MISSRMRNLLLSLTALLALATVFLFAFTPISMSQDEWWHLKTGKWIWQNGLKPPEKDIFAFTSADYGWDNHEWLSETAMYLVYSFGEGAGFGPMRALIAAKTLVLLATFVLVALFGWLRCKRLPIMLFLVVLAVAASRSTMQPRPPVLTYLLLVFFHLTLWAFHSGRIKPLHLLVLPVLMTPWANLHGGFLLGGIAIACYFLGETAQWLWLRRRSNQAEPAAAAYMRMKVLLGIGVLAGLASLITPFGWRLYLLPHRVMSDRTLAGMIWELQPPDLWHNWRYYWPYGALVALTAIGGIFSRRRIFVGEFLLVAFLFWQSWSHLRRLPISS